MKRILIILLGLMLLGVGVSAKKDKPVVNLGTYSTEDGDFQTKFWKEMFKGGGPGRPGNTLQALGDGFIFKKAKIDTSGAMPNGDGSYTTTYIGGELILNSSGPWLNKKKLKATNIPAVNVSQMNAGTGELTFEIVFGGQFDGSEVYYMVMAYYSGIPQIKEDEYGIPVFQRGYDFDAVIVLDDEPISEVPVIDPQPEPGGKVNFDEYSTCEADFNTKFWKEMFKGGGPGQAGNVLKALGDGFIFKQAEIPEGGVVPDGMGGYTTTYVGGVLVLNSSGPWLNKGKLKAVDLTAVNQSTYDPVTMTLDFVLTISGRFMSGEYFKIAAWWDGVPEMRGDRGGQPVFQRGHDFDVRIVIAEEEITEDIAVGCPLY